MATYKTLGKCGLRVSVPILGAMSFGSPEWLSWVVPEDKGVELLKAAWDLGITSIDTANIYSNGESEKIIAKFMTKYQIPREKLVIMTKLWGIVHSDVKVMAALDPSLGTTREYVNQGGLSRAAIFNAVDGILTRLETSYVDLLQIHAPDLSVPMEETMRALHDVVISGKARYIGASNLKAWQLAEMNHIAEKNGWTQFVSMQIEHSLLYRAEELEMIPYCKYKGIGIIPYSPLSGGTLARPIDVETDRANMLKGTPWERKVRESDKEIVKRVQKVAKDHGWTMSQVALAWSLSKATSSIVGANTPERLKDSMTNNTALAAEEVKFLEEPYEIVPPRM